MWMVGEEGLKIGRARICRRCNRGAGLGKRQMSGELWEALLTSPQSQPAAQGRNPQLSRWSFITSIRSLDKKQERSLSSEIQVGHIIVLLIWKKERKVIDLFPFIKLIISIWPQAEFPPFLCIQRLDWFFFSSEYLSRPDNWNPLKCSSNAILVMFWLRLFFFFFFCTGVNLVFVWKPCVRGHFLWHPWTTKRRAAERRRDGWVWNGGWRAFHFYCSTVLILKCNSPGK